MVKRELKNGTVRIQTKRQRLLARPAKCAQDVAEAQGVLRPAQAQARRRATGKAAGRTVSKAKADVPAGAEAEAEASTSASASQSQSRGRRLGSSAEAIAGSNGSLKAVFKATKAMQISSDDDYDPWDDSNAFESENSPALVPAPVASAFKKVKAKRGKGSKSAKSAKSAKRAKSATSAKGAKTKSSEVVDRNTRTADGLLAKDARLESVACAACSKCSRVKVGLACAGCGDYFHLECLGEARTARMETSLDGKGGSLMSYHSSSAGYVAAKVPAIPQWLCLGCRAPVFTPIVGIDDAAGRTAQFNEYGLAMLPPSAGLGRDVVDKLYRLVLSRFEENMETLRARDMLDMLPTGFTTFKMRAAGRFDLMLDELTDPSIFPLLTTEAPWLPLVRELLGDDAQCIHTGCMLSMPGSTTQPYHSDGDHESTKRHRPVHCLNVFIPLVDLTMARGPTEFIPTSHRLGYYEVDEQPMCLTPPAGSVLLFDYRLKHRGRGNESADERPVIYITYARPAFAKKSVANANFSSARYHKMPELLSTSRWRSRADRAAARQARF
ncbi:uncharacterized protein AMSG_09122 [Thecamonas trahens ATCC 50062]|uniref:Zinc finger PHD-type domain-containing protein n=1 Tax=Thecamonas trahens ATCC 50062 TaxID=461836 RepID=A0A0L0DNG1_THETB|nr:hypothetical protein AMSG_09122 [Thecamonas trahens ATCC 50062]KNC52953.1 hypothetical protein AMSG_09122 [Thecamonas trahens ATCC 50062]|eukprot:XP_013754847.1 hypothetical protein AMSG_09122 [Thecamonas trahens ATCC 50062]